MQMVFATQNHLNAVQVALVLCCNKKQFPLKLATFLLKVIEILIKSQAKVTTLQSGHEENAQSLNFPNHQLDQTQYACHNVIVIVRILINTALNSSSKAS